MIPALTVGFIAATVVSALLTAVLIPLLRRAHVLDIPVTRSLHVVPIPRGGGLAIVLTVALTALVAPLLVLHWGVLHDAATRFDVLLAGTAVILAFAGVGLCEDLFSLSSRSRLAWQLLLGFTLGVFVAVETSSSWWLVIPAAVCTCGLVNVTNFMDGANGLTTAHALVSALWYVCVSLLWPVPGLGFIALVLAGACLGFLPFNAPSAKVFLGDSGSYGLGGAWSFAASVSIADGVPTLVAVSPLVVLVADAGYTLWMRVRAGQRWYEPHKLHVYQRLVSAGWPHWGVALLVSATAAACCLLSAIPLLNARWYAFSALAILGLLALYLRLPALTGAPNPFRSPRVGA